LILQDGKIYEHRLSETTESEKRIDVIATAMQGLTVEDLAELELSHTRLGLPGLRPREVPGEVAHENAQRHRQLCHGRK
jgi:hypothetical protein